MEIKRAEESVRSASKSSSPPTNTSGIFSPQRVSPVSLASLNETINIIKNKKHFRESGTCTPTLTTRDVGITPTVTRKQSIGVDTELSVLPHERLYTKRDLDQFLNQQNAAKWMNQVSVGIQNCEVKPMLRQNSTQTHEQAKKVQNSIGVMTRPEVRDVGLHYAPQLRTVGVSDHVITTAKTQSVAVGPDTWATPSVSAISLKSLDRSSSFSLAENEKLKIRRKHAGVQCVALMAHAATQHHPVNANKMVQNVPEVYSQITDTKGLIEHRHVLTGTESRPVRSKDAFCNTELPRTRDASVSARESPRRTIETSVNTERVTMKTTGCGEDRIEIRDLSPERPKTLNLTKTVVERTNMPPSPTVVQEVVSRIPKLSPSPTAPRKFVRQNTYTIASQPPPVKPTVAARTIHEG